MNIKTTLLAAVATLGLSTAAFAVPVSGQISLGGYVQAIGATNILQATGLDFVNANGTSPTATPQAGTAGTLSSYGAGSGSFATLGACASSTTGCGTIQDIANLAVGAQTINSFLVMSGNGETFTFNLSNITVVDRMSSNFLNVTATGTITGTGTTAYDATSGTFFFSAQGNNIVSFSATSLAANVPEPASLAILGGTLAGLGLVRRRKQG